MDKKLDKMFRDRVNSAITRGGGPLEMSKKTGIPLGTIKKYAAKTSTASFTNAAKIALAANIPLEMMAFGLGQSIEAQMGPQFMKTLPPAGQPTGVVDAHALSEISDAVSQAYEKAGVKLPRKANMELIAVYYNEFVMDNVAFDDDQEIAARILLLKKRITKQLAAAKENPGTGKRSAS